MNFSVKFLLVLIATTLIAHAASSDPAKVAVDFLEKVRTGKIDLSPGADTALSQQTADEKKREIARRLERIGHDLGTDALEVAAVKTDENFAAVIVRKVGGLDPSRIQVFPVALVKQGDEWSAAPVPASFENTGVGYAITLRNRLNALENWMLREQVVDLQKLRVQSADRMREKVAAVLSREDLRRMTATLVIRHFITACADKNLPVVLGLLGGLSENLPADWPNRLRSADKAMSNEPAPSHSWHLMTSPNILRVIVNEEAEGDDGFFSIACLNPESTAASGPRIEAIHLELTKSNEGLWRIDPPDSFFRDPTESDDEIDSKTDADLLNAFPLKWQTEHPPSPQTSAQDLHQKLTTTLKSGNLADLLTFCAFGEDPANARKNCLTVAQIWWSLNAPTTVAYAMPVGFQETDTAAVALFQFVSTKEPDKLNLKSFYFEKSSKGWLWSPTPTPASVTALHDLIEPQIQMASDTWQKTLLSSSIQLDSFPKDPKPNQESARQVVESWIQATRKGDVNAALALTTHFAGPNSENTLLRNLGYEVASSRRSNPAPAVIRIDQGSFWTGVGVRTEQDGKSYFPFYPVIQTSLGPRILIEIDLFASRTREFLNKIAFEKLQKSSNPEVSEDLESLFKQFQTFTENPKK